MMGTISTPGTMRMRGSLRGEGSMSEEGGGLSGDGGWGGVGGVGSIPGPLGERMRGAGGIRRGPRGHRKLKAVIGIPGSGPGPRGPKAGDGLLPLRRGGNSGPFPRKKNLRRLPKVIINCILFLFA